MPKFPWTEPRSPINRHLQSTYISLFHAHTIRPPLEKEITNPIPRVEFIREFTTRAYYRYIQVAILFAQRARPQRARKQGISFRQCEVYNTYFVCFLLSGPKIGWRTCATSPSPFSPSQTYASGSANPILYATKTIRTWATRCCFEFASIYIHPASFVHASTEFMYTVSLYPLWQLFLYKPGFNGAFMVLDMLLVEDPWRVLSIRECCQFWKKKKKKCKFDRRSCFSLWRGVCQGNWNTVRWNDWLICLIVIKLQCIVFICWEQSEFR